MLNYKRYTFILLIFVFLLILTDSSMEKQARRSLLSLVNIVVDEGSQVSETAPSSILDSFEQGRINTYNFLDKENKNIDSKIANSKGIIAILLSIAYYLISILKFISGFVITFYPFIIFLLFMFFTSRIFKKDEFGYNDF